MNEKDREIRDRVGRFMLAHGLHMGDKVDAGKVQDMLTEYAVALEDANSLCRSAHSIATRKGLQTNWDAFLGKLSRSLKLQHKLIYGRDYGQVSHD